MLEATYNGNGEIEEVEISHPHNPERRYLGYAAVYEQSLGSAAAAKWRS
jgi:hypothetical protein